MVNPARVRIAATWVILGLVVGVGATLGTILITGVSVADEAGQPLGVDAVSVHPTSVPSPTPSVTPTAVPTATPDDNGGQTEEGDDSAEVVPAPPPVEVELDDHGGDSGGHGSDDSGSGSDNSGSGGSDDSGSGSGSQSGKGSDD